MAAAILAILVAAAYLNSLSGDFVLDARVLVLEDPRVRALTAGNLQEILSRSYWWPYTTSDDLYRPVTTLSYLLNYGVLGHADRPAGYHALNLILHLGNVLLLHAIVFRLTRSALLAFFAAALWAVHPLTTEAVTNIAGRADVLAAFGVLGGFLAYLRATSLKTNRGVWLFIALAAATIGVFSKESAVALVGIIVVYDLLVRSPRPPLFTLIPGWSIVAAPIVALLAVRSVVLAESSGAGTLFVDNPVAAADAWQRALTAFVVLGRYLWLSVWPATLSADYSFAAVPLATGTPSEWAAWITAGAALGITIALVRWNRLAAFGATAAWLAILPAANVLFPTGTIMAERLTYISLAAIVALVAGGAFAAARAPLPRAIVSVVLGFTVLVMAARTSARNRDWQNELTLWTATAAAVPDSFKAHSGLADVLYRVDAEREHLEQVENEMSRSIEILNGAPLQGRPWLPYRQGAVYALELGDRLRERNPGRVTEIASAYERAASHSRGHIAAVEASPWTGPGGLSAAARSRELADGYGLLTTALLRSDRPDEATDAARRALTVDPASPLAYRVLAAAQSEGGYADTAAVTLLTGFLVTGDAPLREAAIELYRGGLDTRGCAVRSTATGTTLDPSCDIVRRHLCAAAVDAARLQRERGRTDLAGGIDQMARTSFGCQS